MLELWLVRHVESEGNRTGRQDETPRSPLGRSQAARLGGALAGIAFDGLYTSDSLCSIETASLALPSAPWQQDLRLGELQEGPKDRFLDVSTRSAAEIAEFLQRNSGPLGESGRVFRARVKSWLDSLPKRGRVVAITHTQVVREILRLSLISTNESALAAIPNASLTRLAIENDATTVQLLSATEHLSSQ